MSIIGIIIWIVFGAIVGTIAKAIHPGEENLTFWQTVLLGVLGSFTGGAANYLLGWSDYLLGSSGLLMSVLGAAITLFAISYINKRDGN